ncbi:DNA-protecting protein DprA [Xylella taiwanensis]|uniref:DNA processing protein DprA n=1 Tax=Xylella taiwanensis TaxID=1444770 RepID=Z9JIK4_9GAMM|nr:DNA-processing protein DprA [Xylella taiwanensis]AXI82885.1 DNA processing protein DprA [Xylella taiwanensis]EWS77557.1 DNA processing protein DprA [Xylella taiwanensis]MCD8455901.1 DNA-processing protein DprA [Xylella taiwanensis]MCD8458305.1 DNA-processing protein DprA [Xylella taiwanensis]MCD8460443.1 DNA-processing protein DprA [Xylella taiwanensis]
MASSPLSDSQDALLRLLLAGGGSAPRRRLLDYHGTPDTALAAGPSAWRASGCNTMQCTRLLAPDLKAIARIQDWLATPSHHLLGWHDPDYPPLLRHIPSPPLALFVAGDPILLWHASIAIVGSRQPSAGGLNHSYGFAQALAARGLGVVSGMAEGIDATAHEAALATTGGRTIAVLGTGPDVAYPAKHKKLHTRITTHGAVISEYPPGTKPRACHFPQRNRIIAGLALGTLVIEAAERSGALITARLAAEAGRAVFAVPGSLHNPMSRGCHQLIRQGATLVQDVEQVLEDVAPLAAPLAHSLRDRLNAPSWPVTPSLSTPNSNDPKDHTLWDALAYDPMSMDSLIDRTGLTAATLSSMLLALELEGKIVVEHGRYARTM